MANEQIDPNAVVAKYQELQSECTILINKLTELEQDRNEHRLVEETLVPLDPNRKAFRLIGGVLVERSVGEILPTVSSNRENLDNVIRNLEENLEAKRKETVEWKIKYNIKTSEEVQSSRSGS